LTQFDINTRAQQTRRLYNLSW